MAVPSWLAVSRLPVLLALFAVLGGGIWLMERSDQQARDTIRKHHLEDIERSLFFARGQHGTYPPYDKVAWCGQLNAPHNAAVKAQVEAVLRAQNEKYGNEAKPFPKDPLQDLSPREAKPAWGRRADEQGQNNQLPDYFYWKRSPALFELYAILEADPTGERSTAMCDNAPPLTYDYGLNSALREERVTLTP